MNASALIKARQPFYVFHKLAYGRAHYLTEDLKWTRRMECAAPLLSFVGVLAFTSMANELDPTILSGAKPSQVVYHANGEASVSA